jgi:hypothetical protein
MTGTKEAASPHHHHYQAHPSSINKSNQSNQSAIFPLIPNQNAYPHSIHSTYERKKKNEAS